MQFLACPSFVIDFMQKENNLSLMVFAVLRPVLISSTSHAQRNWRSNHANGSCNCVKIIDICAWNLFLFAVPGSPRRFHYLFPSCVQEYNIHGWWVGELNGTVGIVPKDFLQPAYILWAPTGTQALSYHEHYGPLLWPNTQKQFPWYSSRLPLRYIQSLTCRLWHLLAGTSTARGNRRAVMASACE